MAESVPETTGFSQDLFSPLQFCEVVEEGQQHRRQLQHLHHQQTSLGCQQITTLQPVSQNQQLDAQTQMQNSSQTVQLTQNEPNKPEVQQQQQTVSSQLLNVSDAKSPALFSAMEIFLPNNSVHLQTVTSPLISLHQPHISQPVYEVQLTRQQQQALQQLQLSPLQISSSQPQSIHISQQCQSQSQEIMQQQPTVPSTSVNIGNISNNTNASYSTPVAVISPMKTANSVSTQATQTEDDEPEIIFTRVSPSDNSSSTCTNGVNKSSVANGLSTTGKSLESSSETKPIPVKRTWRRPWKKKKEREKRQTVKKVRRSKVRRKKFVAHKKHVIHIDPKHGPPIDTSKTVVERCTEVSINQLKQKRQRIKLNRNSGREYVNRLGKLVKARKIGSPCNCPLRCWDRMGSKIVDIFNNFWDLCDFNLQNSYLFTCLKLCDVKRRYTKRPAEESRRQNTFEYFVRISGKHLRVCKKAFMSSHGLTSDKRLRTLFTQMKDGALIPELDKRGKHLRSLRNQSNIQSVSPLSQNNSYTNTPQPTIHRQKPANAKSKTGKSTTKKKLQQPNLRLDVHKPTLYNTPPNPIPHIHPHCTPSPTAHSVTMQEPPHTYIPNGELYFPGHYLDPHQTMGHPHMNQIPPCQKMLEAPAYFMAGMKENTFHQ